MALSKSIHIIQNNTKTGNQKDACDFSSRAMLKTMETGFLLLSGASGMLGGALRVALQSSEAELRQLVRKTPQTPAQICWNPAAPVPVDPSALEGVAAAIHLSGANVAAHRWTAAYKTEMAASRVGSTYALATALARLKQPPRTLLVASAIGFYGDRGEELLDEQSAPGSGFLPELCQAWEDAAEPAVRAGIRVVHLRIGVVLGPQGALEKMLPLFRLGLGGRMGNGRQWMSWIALADVVAAVQFLLEKVDVDGPVNLTAPEPVRNAEFTRALAATVQKSARLPVPALALRLAAGQMADEALLASARVQPARLLEAGFRFKFPHVSAALAVAVAGSGGVSNKVSPIWPADPGGG